MVNGRLLVFGIGSLAFVGAIAACTIVDSLKLPEDATDSGPGGTKDASTKDVFVDPCRSDLLPSPPDPPVGTGNDGNTYFFAVDSVAFSMPGDAGLPVGLNLDKQCTCKGMPADPQSCVPLSPNNTHCDTLGNGIDNAVALLVNGQAKQNGFDVQAQSQNALADGRNGLLMKIDQYTGDPNDSRILFSFYVSAGPSFPDGGGIGTLKPTFTVADSWTVDEGSLYSGADPKRYTAINNTTATVTNDIFVANNLSGVLRLDNGLSLDLKSIELSGRLVKDKDGNLQIDDGVLAGRWTTSSALRNLGALGDPSTPDGGKVCNNAIAFAGLKGLVCAAADISSTGPDNSNVTCDALSLGLRFTAKAATFGAVVNLDAGVSICGSVDTQCTN